MEGGGHSDGAFHSTRCKQRWKLLCPPWPQSKLRSERFQGSTVVQYREWRVGKGYRWEDTLVLFVRGAVRTQYMYSTSNIVCAKEMITLMFIQCKVHQAKCLSKHQWLEIKFLCLVAACVPPSGTRLSMMSCYLQVRRQRTQFREPFLRPRPRPHPRLMLCWGDVP